MLRRSSVPRALMLVALGIAGCGSKVVVDSDQGAGGSGCVAYAAASEAAGCHPYSNHLTMCEVVRANVGVCAGAFDANIACATGAIDAACGPVAECADERAALLACVLGPDCADSQDCDSGGCQIVCGGVVYASECGPSPEPTSCSCYKDGALVGTCPTAHLEIGTIYSMSVGYGCCAQWFAAL